jgi:hypothetical protein
MAAVLPRFTTDLDVGRAVGVDTRVRQALTTRWSARAEIATVVGLYAVYEAVRGVVAGGPAVAVRHAQAIASLERNLGLSVERSLQHAARSVPGLVGVFGVAYLTLHLSVTGAYLVWLYRRHPWLFPAVRTSLLVATAMSVVVFVLYPTAPPRLAGLGIVDTVSGNHVDLNHGLLSAFYNPYAAMPSLHFGYALVVGVGVALLARHRVMRVVGALYPVFVLAVILATGNHFVLDAVAGAILSFAALKVARHRWVRQPPTTAAPASEATAE